MFKKPRWLAKRAEIIGHCAIGAAIAAKGFAVLEHVEVNWALAILCWVSATTILLCTAFHRRLATHIPSLAGLVLLLEAFVAVAIAFSGFHEGKVALPSSWFAVAVGYAAAGVFRLYRESRQRRAQSERSAA